jgi:DNA-binding response OmpR family regulator
VLIVMSDQWPRALLRAALREQGYDAVGTRNLTSALRIRRDEPERGPVQLIVVDQPALAGAGSQLNELLNRHRAPATLLLARSTQAIPEGNWAKIIRRPVSIADIVTAVESLIPLAPENRHPLDE